MKNTVESLSGDANEYIRCLAGSHPLRKPVILAMPNFLHLKKKGLNKLPLLAKNGLS